jgi:hypothetical protein
MSRHSRGYTGGLGGREAIRRRTGFDPLGFRCSDGSTPRLYPPSPVSVSTVRARVGTAGGAGDVPAVVGQFGSQR